MALTKVISLKSSDDETFKIDETVVLVSETIKNMIDDGCADDVIPLPNVSSKILPKVIEYCKYVRENGSTKENINGDEIEKETRAGEELNKWEAEFMDIDQGVLYDLMLAANYLDIKGLLDLTVKKAVSMIRGKTPDQIREIFKIENDFTPEEEEEIRKENAWAFE